MAGTEQTLSDFLVEHRFDPEIQRVTSALTRALGHIERHAAKVHEGASATDAAAHITAEVTSVMGEVGLSALIRAARGVDEARAREAAGIKQPAPGPKPHLYTLFHFGEVVAHTEVLEVAQVWEQSPNRSVVTRPGETRDRLEPTPSTYGVPRGQETPA